MDIKHIGKMAMTENDTVSALKNFMTSRMQQSDFVDPLIQIAHIYSAQNDTLAKSFYKEAMIAAPDNYYIVYDYAMYLQENGFPEEALSYYDTLLEIMPDNTDFNFNKGYVYLVYLGENEQALECFNKVLQIDPTSVDALFNKGRTYEQNAHSVRSGWDFDRPRHGHYQFGGSCAGAFRHYGNRSLRAVPLHRPAAHRFLHGILRLHRGAGTDGGGGLPRVFRRPRLGGEHGLRGH